MGQLNPACSADQMLMFRLIAKWLREALPLILHNLSRHLWRAQMWVIHPLSLSRKSFPEVLGKKAAVFLYHHGLKMSICLLKTYPWKTLRLRRVSLIQSDFHPPYPHSYTFVHTRQASVFTPTWVILLWLAKNIERFWDSWMDWGSAIFLKNWAALEAEEEETNVNLALTEAFYNDFLYLWSITSCRQSDHSWRYTSCSSARPAQQTC